MDVLTRVQAVSNVLEYVAPFFSGIDDIVINEPYVIENDDAWVFPYNSKRFLESDDISFALMSNVPILVCKRTGTLHHYPAAMTATEMLNAFSTGQNS